jgi:amino acid transporter
VTAVIYIAGTVAVLAALRPAAVDATSGVMQTIADVSSKAGWELLTPVGAALVAVSCLGSCGAWLGTVARIPFVAGIDRYLPRAFGRLDGRGRSPNVALFSQSAIAGIVVLLGQGGSSVKSAYDILVSSTVIVTLLPFLFLFASAFKLYERPAAGSGRARIPGGRATIFAAAALGFFTTFAAIVLAFFPADAEPNKAFAVAKVSFLTLGMTGSGVAVFIAGSRRRDVRSTIAA